MNPDSLQVNPSATAAAAFQANLPAAQQLAQVIPTPLGSLVRLPPRFARAAVERWLANAEATGDVLEGPCEAGPAGPGLKTDQWAIRVRAGRFQLYLPGAGAVSDDGRQIHIFPKHTVILTPRGTPFLLGALERVKPDEVDASGRPVPWVPPRQVIETLESLSAKESENDIEIVGAEAPLPPETSEEPSESVLIRSDQIVAEINQLAARAGFATAPPLIVKRGLEPRDGFVSGRVTYTSEFRVLRVRLTTCPNSDWAEILSTAAHELAHPLSRTFDHGPRFKTTLVELAARQWGDSWFAEARRRIDESYHVVDRWVTCGIRAALRNGEPPVAKQCDDGQLARVLSRIRKLRDLAEDQVGLPEGISATAAANDLITTYRLEGCHFGDGNESRDQMVDRWITFDDDAAWKRNLAAAIARFFDTFSLTVSKGRRMHLFGRYADLVTVEYLHSICMTRIVRECKKHLSIWKSQLRSIRPGDVVRERVSFCDSAVAEFRKKLDEIKAGLREGGALQEDETAEAGAAEEFARVEFAKRGLSWGAGRRRTYRNNPAGRAVGRSLEIVRGLSSTGEAQRRLRG